MIGESAFITRLSRLLADGTVEVEALHARHHEIHELLARSQRGDPMTSAPSTALMDLDELRKFRHFFRNAYVLDSDPVRTIEHAQRVENTHPPVAAGIATLFQHVEAVIQSLARQ